MDAVNQHAIFNKVWCYAATADYAKTDNKIWATDTKFSDIDFVFISGRIVA